MALAVTTAATLVVTGVDRVRAAASPCEFDGIERIVAVGDVHGAYDRFLEILRAAEVIDATGHWSGGRTHLVQLGDVLDRGPDSRKVLDFLPRLAKEAASAGGRVHALIGNHEAMRLLGDLRYVTPGEYAAFTTRDSEDLRRQVVESAAPPNARAQLLSQTPLGMVEMVRAFAVDADYGKYLLGLNAVERLNGVVFLHGGISPAVKATRCADINTTVHRDLSSNIAKTKAKPTEALTTREDGPLWYRGLAEEPDTFAPEVDAILKDQQARAIVVAHTVRQDGRIAPRFGGKVFLIDTGMQQQYVPTGQPSALEIRGDVFTAIYRDSREVIRSAGGAPVMTVR
jgi:calcineurin-like phosphoesterase family protein